MIYEQVQSLKPEAFKRLCGVGYTTFAEMLSVKRTTETQETQTRSSAKTELRRSGTTGVTILARVPYLLSHCSKLEHQ